MDKITKETLAAKLRDLRETRGLSIEEIAEFVSVKPKTVQKWELATETPTFEDIMIICNECDITVPDFFNGNYFGSYSSENNDAGIELYKEQIEALQNANSGSTTSALISLIITHALCALIILRGPRIDPGYIFKSFTYQFICTLIYVYSLTRIMIQYRNNHVVLRVISIYCVIGVITQLYINYYPVRNLITGPMMGYLSYSIGEMLLCLTYGVWLLLAIWLNNNKH